MGNILTICGKGGNIVLSKSSSGDKKPWDRSMEWASPDVTIASHFVSSLNSSEPSYDSTTLNLNEDSTLLKDDTKTESSLQDEKPRKTVQFDEDKNQRIENMKKFIKERENKEESALCKAIHEGSVYSYKNIKRLVESGEDVNCRDNQGDPILYTALFYGQYDVVNLLISHAVDVNTRNKQWDPVIYTAVQSGKPHIVETLIQAGADINCKSSKGDPVLYTAVLSRQKEMVQILLKYGADVNIRNTLGTSCLEEAMTSDQLDILEMLVEAGADIDIKDKEGNHLLHVAMMFKQLDCLRMLLNYGADVNIADKEGNPALEMAILMKHTEAIRLLLENGADVNLKNNKGIPVFYKAIFKNGSEIIKMMINNGADVNIQDSVGKTALFKAIERNNFDALNLLIMSSADGNVKDYEGETCLEYALHMKNVKPNIIQNLAESGICLHTDFKDDQPYITNGQRKLTNNIDDYVTFCDRALFMTSEQSKQHIRQWKSYPVPDKYWFNKVNIICDHVNVDCIIDGRLQLAYETLQQITVRQRKKEADDNAATIKDTDHVEDVHPFEAEDPKAVTEFELLLTTKNKISDGLDINRVTHEGNSLLHLAVKYQNQCLLRYILKNDGNPYKRNRKSLSPFKMAFKINAKSLIKPMSTYIESDFSRSFIQFSFTNDRLWTGWKCLCKKHKTPKGEFCSSCPVIVMDTSSTKIPPLFFFKSIEIVCHSSTKLMNVEPELDVIAQKLKQFDILPYKDGIHLNWEALTGLFQTHSNLICICPSYIRSVNYSNDSAEHELVNEACIRLICKMKGVIPINEDHFPKQIQGYLTDCIEDDINIFLTESDKNLFFTSERERKFKLIALQRNDYNTGRSTIKLDHKKESRVHILEDDSRATCTLLSDPSTLKSTFEKIIQVQNVILTFPIDFV